MFSVSFAPIITQSEPFTLWYNKDYMASFPSFVATERGTLLSFRLAPKEPHNYGCSIGHQQHLHPRSALALTYLNDKLSSEEFSLFPVDLFAADQDPNLCRLPNGNLMMSSFSWRPQAYGDCPNQTAGFFHEKSSGVSALFWGAFTAQSADEGLTWTSRLYLPGLPGFPDLIPGKRRWRGGRHRGQIIATSDGRLLMGTYDRLNNKSPFRSFLFQSSNFGNSWEFCCDLTCPLDEKIGFAEPTLHNLSNGDILGLYRTFGADDRLAINRSCDEGKSWSPPDLKHVKGHPFYVTAIDQDWAVLLYAVRSQESSIRARLLNRWTGCISEDEKIIRYGAKTKDIGYPTGSLLSDGRLLISYYWVGDDGSRIIEGVTLSFN